ncbi:hypothetical protein Syun_008884 [Stephania yunnanensis]|uniref:SWIM-type domain-containing protein n=1 Tax=Stephania yunnanensis TaxID=152371 RepID=A0AAP0KEK4_9MAGN
MDDLEMARAAFIRDIFGSSDIEGSSHESLVCEDNSVPLVDEVSISNVIHEQDFNIVSHPILTVGMSFGSVDELLETYQDHAKEKVEYRANGQYFDCNCRKFETSGIICRHIFEVMKMKGIARVHERYITRRWRKDVLRRHLSIVHFGGYPQMTDEYKKFKEIERALHEAVDLCANNPARLGFLKTEMEAIIERVKNYNDVIQVEQTQHLGNDTCIQDPNHVFIRDPNYVRCRGRPRLNRFRSIRERGGTRRNSSRGQGRGQGSEGQGEGQSTDLGRGGQERHGGRRKINVVSYPNRGEDFIDLNEPVVESQNYNAES